MIQGKRYSKGGFSSKRNAELYEAQQHIAKEKAMLGFPGTYTLEIRVAFSRYLEWAQDNKKPKAVMRDKSSMGIWQVFFEQEHLIMVKQLTQQTLQRFIEWRLLRTSIRGKSVSKRTINLDLITLRHVLNWGVQAGILTENPIPNIPISKQRHPDAITYLTKEEVGILERIALQKNPDLFLAIFVLARTGIRSGELCSLSIDNLDFESGQVVLKSDQTKASRSRAIPMSQAVKAVMLDLVNQARASGREILFVNGDRNAWTTDNLQRRFRTLLKQAAKEGFYKQGVTIHTLRRTYISHMVMAGVDPVKVMAIVGHQDWSTIKRYLILSKEYILEDCEKLPY